MGAFYGTKSWSTVNHLKGGKDWSYEFRGQLIGRNAVEQFIFGGKATFTVESVKTENAFTYRVDASDTPGLFFVKLLAGPDNESNYVYLGTFRNGRYQHGKKSSVSPTAKSVLAIEYFSRALAQPEMPSTLRIWHEGRCAHCQRKLTVPESIATGYGPDCSEKLGIEWTKPAAPVCIAA